MGKKKEDKDRCLNGIRNLTVQANHGKGLVNCNYSSLCYKSIIKEF